MQKVLSDCADTLGIALAEIRESILRKISRSRMANADAAADLRRDRGRTAPDHSDGLAAAQNILED